MARLIPDIVDGMDLFVPDAYDYFSIDSGGMPNGDDCLIVHGDVSQNYRAFARGNTALTPNIFGVRNSVWALTFWFKGANVTSTTQAATMVLLYSRYEWTGSMSAIGVQANAEQNNNQAFLVSMAGHASNPNPSIGFQQPRGASTGQNAAQASQALSPSLWNMVTINQTSGGCVIYINDSSSGAASGSTPTALSYPLGDHYLSIGKYGPAASAAAREGEYRLGKVCFHDHALNHTERLLLWNAMMNP